MFAFVLISPKTSLKILNKYCVSWDTFKNGNSSIKAFIAIVKWRNFPGIDIGTLSGVEHESITFINIDTIKVFTNSIGNYSTFASPLSAMTFFDIRAAKVNKLIKANPPR